MIALMDITEDNFNECAGLDVEPYQKAFVASNTYSLAQAWLYPDHARPFALYHSEAVVGFAMLDVDYSGDGSQGICELWRFMIDKRYQGKGYGRASMEALIAKVRENPKHHLLRLSFVPGNEAAEKLYKSMGFFETGERDGTEIVLVLPIA